MVTEEEELQEPTEALHLRVSAEADPGAMTRVVSFRVLAGFRTNDLLRIWGISRASPSIAYP